MGIAFKSRTWPRYSSTYLGRPINTPKSGEEDDGGALGKLGILTWVWKPRGNSCWEMGKWRGSREEGEEDERNEVNEEMGDLGSFVEKVYKIYKEGPSFL